jgi:hypothetical protein
LNVSQSDFALLQFDLSPLPASVTAANIQKATLTVFVNKAFSSGNLALGLAPTPWQESTATYNNVGLPIVTTPYTMAVNASDTYVTFDVTSIVASWISNPSANYGLELYSFEGSASLSLDSKEATATSHAATIDVTLKLPEGSCTVGQAVTGVNQNGNPTCAPLLSSVACPSGQVVLGLTASGVPVCGPPIAGGACNTAGQVVTAVNASGVPVCGPPIVGGQCPSGQAVISINSNGVVTCGAVLNGLSYYTQTGIIPNGFQGGDLRPACAQGQKLVGGGCDSLYQMDVSTVGYFPPTIVKATPLFNGQSFATAYECQFFGGTGTNMPVSATAICANSQ